MDEWILPALAVVLIAYAGVSGRLRSSPLTQAMLFVTLGLLVSSTAMDVVDLSASAPYVRHFAEATLALMLFTDAVRINLGRLRQEASVPVRLLGLGLPLTIVAGTAAGLLILPGLGLWTAAALATILAPTDAALGQPVVSNQRLPSRIRQGLNVESGLNDGICVPLLIIFLTLAEADEDVAELDPVVVVLEEIGYGAVGGVVAAVFGGWVLRRCAARGWISVPWQQIGSVAIALLAYTTATALGGSGFIATFTAGVVFALVAGPAAEPSTALAEQSAEALNAVTFLLFGAVLLGPSLTELDWRIAVYAATSLTLVRMLPVLLALLGLRMRAATVVFLGWFGPRGLASIVFVLLLVEESSLPERALILDVVTLTVGLSVFAHGATAWLGANRYADWYAAHRGLHPAMPESTPVPHIRTRAEDHPHHRG